MRRLSQFFGLQVEMFAGVFRLGHIHFDGQGDMRRLLKTLLHSFSDRPADARNGTISASRPLTCDAGDRPAVGFAS